MLEEETSLESARAPRNRPRESRFLRSLLDSEKIKNFEESWNRVFCASSERERSELSPFSLLAASICLALSPLLQDDRRASQRRRRGAAASRWDSRRERRRDGNGDGQCRRRCRFSSSCPSAPSSSSTRTTPAAKLAEALACNFCARVLLDAVVAPNCMHAFCAPCADAWVEARAAACPCCVASGARQPTPLGDGAYAAGRLQPDLTLRALVSKVMPFAKGDMGSESETVEEEWNLRFAQALEPAKRGAVAARGFLTGGAPCVGGVSAAGAAGAAAAAAAAAQASAANTTGATTATGAPRFNRAAPPPRGTAVLLLMTPDPLAPRRRNPGYLQRPYVRAPRVLALNLLGRYLSDRMRVAGSAVKWRFEARGARRRGSGGGGGGGSGDGGNEDEEASTTHDGTEAVAAVLAARGAAVTMAELASAAWGRSEDEEDFERLDRPLVAFYRT